MPGGCTVKLPTLLVFSTNLLPFVQKRRMALSKQALHPSLWKEKFFPPNRSVSHPSWAGEMFCFFSAAVFFFPPGLELIFNRSCSVPWEPVEMAISAGLIFAVISFLTEPGW